MDEDRQDPGKLNRYTGYNHQATNMAKKAEKYFHKQMDRDAGLAHTIHRTKIVATVGPACDTYDKLLELVKTGVNIFRLNFSHGTYENKAAVIDHIRKINKTEPY